MRNREGELTSFCSGDRFLYVRGGFRRVLPPVIDIDHQRCRILHKSQDSACKRCRYMGHCHQDTGKCDAYVNDHNIITIRSPNHVLCNYCMCDVDAYVQPFISSEHAYQWKFTSHIGRHDLADEILSTSNPELAKEVSSRVPRHMHKEWHSIKIGVMEEVLKAKLSSCSEFKKALISSKGKRLVETVKNDRFWSCGLTPKYALSTKTDYYPGQNQLGMLLELLRDGLNCNIESHPQTLDEHHLVINNKKLIQKIRTILLSYHQQHHQSHHLPQHPHQVVIMSFLMRIMYMPHVVV